MRIVVKVGTSTLTHTSGRINIRRTEKLCKILSDVKNAGHELILVSSGAIGMGVGKLNMKSKPEDMPTKQAAAAIGQCELMYLYDKLFREYNHIVAQMLITGLDFSNEESHKNFQSTLNRLLELNVIPINSMKMIPLQHRKFLWVIMIQWEQSLQRMQMQIY